MALIERYRVLYEHEKDCTRALLAMLESVPEAARGDARFRQAVTLADHLAACRGNWLDYMEGKRAPQAPWWDRACDPAALGPRYVDWWSRRPSGA